MSVNSAEELNIGEVVDGRYRLDRRIGSGGMGVVYQAHHQILDEPVAIKFLNRELVGSEVAQRFFREAMITAKVRHENVVTVLDVGMLGSRPFIVMELLRGETLAERIEREGPISVLRALEVLVPAFRGIAAAHQRGIIHRDIKPSNIFITRTARGAERPKVVDFGISRMVDDAEQASLTQTGQIMGTPRYMAPEQLKPEAGDIDHRADIYSMGVTVYETLCGVPPFAGNNAIQVALDVVSMDPRPLSELAPDVNPALGAVVMKALAKPPSDRFADANEFIAELQAGAGVEIDGPGVPLESGFAPAHSQADADWIEAPHQGAETAGEPPAPPAPSASRFATRLRRAFSVGSPAASPAASPIGVPDSVVISAGVNTQIGRLGQAPAPSEYFSQLRERAPVTISSWRKDLDAGTSAFFENNNKRLRHLEKMIDFYGRHLNTDYEHLTTQMRWTQRLWLFCVAGMFLIMAGAIVSAVVGSLDLQSLGVMAMAELLAGFLLKVFQSREEHYRKLRDRKGEHLVYGRRWSLAVQSIDAMPAGEQKAAAIKDLVKVLLRELEPTKVAA